MRILPLMWQRSVRASVTRRLSSSAAKRSRRCRRSPLSARIRAGGAKSSRAMSYSYRNDSRPQVREASSRCPLSGVKRRLLGEWGCPLLTQSVHERPLVAAIHPPPQSRPVNVVESGDAAPNGTRGSAALVTADALVTRRYVRQHSPKFVGELLFRRCRPDRHGRTRVFAARRRWVGAQ